MIPLFLAVYLVALIGVGAVKARSVRTQEDFSLAGRGLSTFVLVGTLLATWIGTGSIFGNAEKAYGFGIATALLPLASALGIVVLVALAPRIRRFGAFTIQDILEARFGPAARVLGTITLVAAYVVIVGYQYRAGAVVLERVMPGVGHAGAVGLVALFVVLYTALAGMISVAYTDVANGILMTFGLLACLGFLLVEAGGPAQALAALEPDQRDLFGHYPPAHLLSITLPAFLLLIGDANMVQRFFSARDPRSARRAAAWMFGGVLLLDWAIVAVALVGRALVAQGRIPAPQRPAEIVVHVAFEALPPVLGALLVATVVAVVVSTADSYLLAPATALVRDVYQRFVAPDAEPRRAVRVGRVAVVALGALALALAFTSDAFFDVALFAYTIYGAGITPALLAAYLWPRATAAGATASIVTGVAVALAWKALSLDAVQRALAGGALDALARLGRGAEASGVDAVIPAALSSAIVLVAVSLAGAPPPDERARAF